MGADERNNLVSKVANLVNRTDAHAEILDYFKKDLTRLTTKEGITAGAGATTARMVLALERRIQELERRLDEVDMRNSRPWWSRVKANVVSAVRG